jgi:chromosome segregation ATPase
MMQIGQHSLDTGSKVAGDTELIPVVGYGRKVQNKSFCKKQELAIRKNSEVLNKKDQNSVVLELMLYGSELENSNEELLKKISAISQQNNILTNKFESLENKTAELKRGYKDLQKKCSDEEKEKEVLKKETQDLQEDYKKLNANYGDLEKKLNDAEAENKKLQSQSKALEDQYVELVDEYAELQTQNEALKSESVDVSQKYVVLETQHEKLDQQTQTLQNKFEQLNDQYDKLQTIFEQAIKNNARIQAEMAEQLKKIGEIKGEPSLLNYALEVFWITTPTVYQNPILLVRDFMSRFGFF